MLCDAAAASAARHRQQDARPLAVVTLLTYFYWVLTRALVVQALAGGCGEGLCRSCHSAVPASSYLYPPHLSLSLSLSDQDARPPRGRGWRPGRARAVLSEPASPVHAPLILILTLTLTLTPTLTPSLTLSPTLTPSLTLTPTPTFILIPTPTPALALTLALSLTLTRTLTLRYTGAYHIREPRRLAGVAAYKRFTEGGTARQGDSQEGDTGTGAFTFELTAVGNDAFAALRAESSPSFG